MSQVDPRLLDLNLFESIREFARWQEGSLIAEEDGILLASGASDSVLGYSNGAARIDSGAAPELVLERADQMFGGQGRGYTLWVRVPGDEDLERAAKAHGLRLVTEAPWMVLSDPIAALSAGAVDVHEVKDEDGVRAAARVNREAYQSLAFSPEEVDAIFGLPRRALSPQVRIFVAWENGEPVSTATLLSTAGVGGIYWVGTLESHRKRGLGGACTRAAANAAFDDGARVVTLQATRMGEPLYRSIGFRPVSKHRWLVSAAPPA